MKATFGLVTSASKLGAPVGRHGHDVKVGGRQTLRLAADGHCAPVDLAQKIGDIVGDRVDDVKRERLGGRQACRGTHGLGGPIGIAAIECGEAANIRDGVVDDLARLGVRRFAGLAVLRFLFPLLLLIRRQQRIAAELNRRGGANIGAGRHRRDCACVGDIGAGTGRTRSVRRDIGDDRHRRCQDRADDLAHRRVEAARRVHPKNDKPDLT